jgi:hypothetical protein
MTPIDFSRLEKLSQRINQASDDLSKFLATINEKLNSLNLGIATGITDAILMYELGMTEDGKETYIQWTLGYGSLDGKWGMLATRQEFIREQSEDEVDESDRLLGIRTPLNQDTYFLLSCSRKIRIAAISAIPTLIAKLESESEDFIKTVNTAKKLADEL